MALDNHNIPNIQNLDCYKRYSSKFYLAIIVMVGCGFWAWQGYRIHNNHMLIAGIVFVSVGLAYVQQSLTRKDLQLRKLFDLELAQYSLSQLEDFLKSEQLNYSTHRYLLEYITDNYAKLSANLDEEALAELTELHRSYFANHPMITDGTNSAGQTPEQLAKLAVEAVQLKIFRKKSRLEFSNKKRQSNKKIVE